MKSRRSSTTSVSPAFTCWFSSTATRSMKPATLGAMAVMWPSTCALSVLTWFRLQRYRRTPHVTSATTRIAPRMRGIRRVQLLVAGSAVAGTSIATSVIVVPRKSHPERSEGGIAEAWLLSFAQDDSSVLSHSHPQHQRSWSMTPSERYALTRAVLNATRDWIRASRAAMTELCALVVSTLPATPA